MSDSLSKVAKAGNQSFWTQHAKARNQNYKSKSYLDSWLESNKIPNWLLRIGIQMELAERIKKITFGGDIEKALKAKIDYFQKIKSAPIALHTAEANEQHYECPPSFFEAVLGPRLKYSCSYYPTGKETLQGKLIFF